MQAAEYVHDEEALIEEAFKALTLTLTPNQEFDRYAETNP